jgi:hypothetical protein
MRARSECTLLGAALLTALLSHGVGPAGMDDGWWLVVVGGHDATGTVIRTKQSELNVFQSIAPIQK